MEKNKKLKGLGQYDEESENYGVKMSTISLERADKMVIDS